MKKISFFFAGMAVSMLLCLCVTTALAVSGAVSFNQVNVTVNEIPLFNQGEPITTSAGTAVPSTITYTDEQGNPTHYVSVRALGDAFGMPVNWDGDTNSANLSIYNSVSTYLLSTYFTANHAVGSTIDGVLEEVEPIFAQEGTVILAPTEHQSWDLFEADLLVEEDAGAYVSITVTNYEDVPVNFGLGRHYTNQDDQTIALYATVPAHETITRTMEISDIASVIEDPIYLCVNNPQYVTRPIHVTISAVQFE